MHEPLRVVGEWLGRVLRGYYQHHAVPGNFDALMLIRERVSRYCWHVLGRRRYDPTTSMTLWLRDVGNKLLVFWSSTARGMPSGSQLLHLHSQKH